MEGLKQLFLPITATIKFIQNHFKAMLFLLLLFLIFAPSSQDGLSAYNLKSINLAGPIFDTTDVVYELEDARQDSGVEGVLLIVDSPGGAVAPSLEVAYAVKRLSQSKPVVVYAKGTLASGSYYASIWADEIMANPGSMVGSIGVIMQGINTEELMSKIGIKSQVASRGEFKQVGTSDREWSKAERAEIQKVIDGTYEMFVSDVSSARDLNISQSHLYADAHIFTAAQAKEVGLVDTLGVLYDAKLRLETLSGVQEPIWNQESRVDKFIKEIGAKSAQIIHTYFPNQSLH